MVPVAFPGSTLAGSFSRKKLWVTYMVASSVVEGPRPSSPEMLSDWFMSVSGLILTQISTLAGS